MTLIKETFAPCQVGAGVPFFFSNQLLITVKQCGSVCSDQIVGTNFSIQTEFINVSGSILNRIVGMS